MMGVPSGLSFNLLGMTMRTLSFLVSRRLGLISKGEVMRLWNDVHGRVYSQALRRGSWWYTGFGLLMSS